MQAIVLNEPGRFGIIDQREPAPPATGQAMVRVQRVGVCGTDLHAFRGDQPFFEYPRILGHELGVEVVALGESVTGVNVGDRCAVEPYLNCGACIACRRGKQNCCATLQVLGVHVDGGMRPLLTVPAHKLHPSPALSLEQLALVETLAIGAHAVERARLERGEHVLVIGAGPIGLTVMEFAKLAGANVIAMDVNAARLEFCRTQMGVEHCIDATTDSLTQLRKLTGDDLPTAVFDATGNPRSMVAAFDDVAPGGRLVFVGLCLADITLRDPHLHRREITLLASRNALPHNFTDIIALIEAERIDTTPWITHHARFDDMIDAFPTWLDPQSRVIKAMLHID